MSNGDTWRRVVDGFQIQGARTSGVRCGGCIVRNSGAGYRIATMVVAATYGAQDIGIAVDNAL